MLAALFVEKDGVYFGLPGVDAWDASRDARTYTGPHPVVAHPPCKRWGKFFHGSTAKPHQFRIGEDQGCFAAALTAVRNYGGVLEHPADSKAFAWFGLPLPIRGKGWTAPDTFGGSACYVEQGHYGHMSRKGTWLYAVGVELPALNWTRGEQRLHPVALERYGYAKARRIGMVAMVGGKDKEKIRDRTPVEFRDVLIGMALTARLEYADWKERVAAIFSRLHNEPIEKWREHMAACGEDCWREMYDDGLTPSNTVNEELRNAG